jgi:protein-tyrosine phosphatase
MIRATPYSIEGPWVGRLAILPRPRGGDWLEEEVRSWVEAGIEVVVSLLTQEEISELDLSQESAVCKSQGIEFVTLAIPDRGVPASPRAFRDLLEQLGKALANGKSVAIHCRQGIGRSGLIAAGLLIFSGIEAGPALERISAARGCPVPETNEQRNWIEQFARQAPVLPKAASKDRG